MIHPTIQLKVISGPDKSKTLRFQKPYIRIGRDPRKNDFILTDQYVSACHGQLSFINGQLVYRDLKSRHGTSITTITQDSDGKVENRFELHNHEEFTTYTLNSNAQLLFGSTLVYLTFVSAPSNDTVEEQISVVRESGVGLSYRGSSTPHSGSSSIPILVDSSGSSHLLGNQGRFGNEGVGHLSDKIYQSLKELEGDYRLEDTKNIPNPEAREKTTPETRSPIAGNFILPTVDFKQYQSSLRSKGLGSKISLQSKESSSESITNANEAANSDFSFEALAKIPMKDSQTLRSFQSQTETEIVDAALSRDIKAFILPNENKLDVLFRLSNQLNQLNHLDDILELIVESTFEAFPSAQFFALYRTDRDSQREENPDSTKLNKYLSRVRDNELADADEVILSESLLVEVAQKKEAILFTRDNHVNPTVSIIEGEIWSSLCAPLIGQRSLLGVMLVDTRHQGSLFTPQDLNLFSVLASNAAFAIERTQLTEEIVNMFEGFVQASVSAIEARDPTTAGHSERVATYALSLAEAVNDVHVGSSSDIYFSKDELVELRYAALLHDIGKVGVREQVLNKAYRITDDRMSLIRQRFDSLKLDYQLYLTNKLLMNLRAQGRSPSDLEVLQILKEAKLFGEELDETSTWLDRIRRAEYLSPEDLQRVQFIGARKVHLDQGRSVSLLEDFETENLSIVRGTLNNEEWQDMRSHAKLSETYLEQIPWSSELRRVPCIAGAHHEKLDGSGYPKGLSEADLIPQIRILTIADIFDALTAWDRPYRKAIPHAKAVSILAEEASSGKLDKQLVHIFSDRVIPTLEQQNPPAISRDEQPVVHLRTSPTFEPLNTSSSHYTLFQQERFQPTTNSSKVDDSPKTEATQSKPPRKPSP